MINIIDTLSQINSLFDNRTFNIEKWENYINSIYDKSADIFKNDLKEYDEMVKKHYSEYVKTNEIWDKLKTL